MPELKLYRLFISHAWNYNDEYHRLVGMLNAANNFLWYNYSVPEHDPLSGGSNAKLATEIDKQIRPVNAVLILAGMYVNHSDWIQREIELALSYAKPVIGIKPWGTQRIPQAVQAACLTMVGWNTDSIVQAIRQCSI